MSTETHGRSNDAIYAVWRGMKQRCCDKSHISYKNYGAKGITICEEWMNSFENFIKDMGERPDGDYSIERANGNGNYSPDNCFWATRTEQNNNRGNYNVLIEHDGKSLTRDQWAEITGIKATTIRKRLSLGWDVAKALTAKPVIGRNQHGTFTA